MNRLLVALALLGTALGLSGRTGADERLAAQVSGLQTKSTGLIAGRIVDSGGAPVPAAVVSIRRASPVSQSGRAQAAFDRVLTDDAGRFVFSNVAAGAYPIEATKPGWLDGASGRRRPGGASTPVEIAEGQRRNDLSITLWRAAVIGGRVLDDNGDPLVGAEVRAVRQTFIAGRRQSDTPIRARTDDRGEYRFAGLFPGDYIVAVLASVLSEPAAFAGARSAISTANRSYLQTMAAVGVAPIVFDRATGVAGPDRPLVSGLSLLPGVPSGDNPWLTYPTTYQPAGLTMGSAAVIRVNAGDVRSDANVTVRLIQTWQVSGVLRDAAGPAPWHAVHLVPAESADSPLVDVATALTDAKGEFTLYGVPPGQYIARVVRIPWPSGGGLALAGSTGEIPFVATLGGGPSSGPPTATDPLFHVSESVTVGERHVRGLALTMREGVRVRGRARFEGESSQPTPNQLRNLVSFWPANGRASTGLWPAQFTSDGQFTSSSLWPGRYVIRAGSAGAWTFKSATHRGRDVSDIAVDLTADLDEVILTFTDRPQTIKGTVQGEPGKPPDGSIVLLFPADPAGWVDYGRTSRRVTSATVTRTGEFSFALPSPGEYLLIAIPEESADDWQNPAILSKLATLAERVLVRDTSLTQALQIRRIQ